MNMSNQLAVVSDFDTIKQVATAMVESGYFTDSKSASQGIVKIMAGQELGLGAFASMTGIHIIQGKPSLGANLIASLIKNDPRYNYRVIEMTDAACEIAFYEDGQECGRSVFTAADAKKCGTKNMDKYPRNMLFARAISNGAKWYTPGIFGGAPVYTPEELGADVDEDGNIIDVTPQSVEIKPEMLPNNYQNITSKNENVKRVWPQETIMAVHEAGGYKAVKHTVAILDLSTMPADTPADVMVAWHAEYRRQRDAEVDVKSAAAAADAACEPSDG